MTDVRVGSELLAVLQDPEPTLQVGGIIAMTLRKRVETNTFLEVGSVQVNVLREPAIIDIQLGSLRAQLLRRTRARSRLVWEGSTKYETGIDHGVLYPEGGPGVVWNGLTAVDDASVGGEIESFHFDGFKYLDVVARKNYQGTLQAFSAPREFDACLGLAQVRPGFLLTKQPKKRFGLSYRVLLGNDEGYKLHLVYNATASPLARGHNTITNSAEPEARSWQIDAVPVVGEGYSPSAHFIIDSTQSDPEALALIEAQLYGTETSEPRMPDFSRVVAVISDWAPKIVIPHSDTGLSELVLGTGDMTTSEIDGLYLPLPAGRLVESSIPGLYTLME